MLGGKGEGLKHCIVRDHDRGDDDDDLCDGLGEHLLQGGPAGPALLQGVGWYLHCEGPGLAGRVPLLCRDGDLDRDKTVGVRDDYMLSSSWWHPPISSSSSSHLGVQSCGIIL